MATAGERFTEAVLDYLLKNKLLNSRGHPSLGRINGAILTDIYDRFAEAEGRRDKADKVKRLSKVERAALFEALALGTGSDSTAMTEAELRRCGVAVSAIVKATPDVTSDDIAEACRLYKHKMNGATISTSAVSNNWSKLYQPKNKSRSSPGVEAIPEPDDWRGLIRDDEEDGRYSDKEWVNIHPFYQARIIKKIARVRAGR